MPYLALSLDLPAIVRFAEPQAAQVRSAARLNAVPAAPETSLTQFLENSIATAAIDSPKPVAPKPVAPKPVAQWNAISPQHKSSLLTQAPAPSTPFPPTQSTPTPAIPIPTIPAPTIPTQPTPAPTPQPGSTPTPNNIPTQQLNGEGILELRADRQDYDERRRIFTAEGNVSLRFRGALLTGNRLQVNLLNRLTIAEGNVVLTRGDQVLRGQRFRYNLIQEEGTIESASGEIFLPTAQTDFNPNLPTDISAGTLPSGLPGDRFTATQPAQNVTQSGRVGITLGSRRNTGTVGNLPTGGSVQRLRFEAEQIEFYPEGWQARNIRITNDPFSPPELELRANRATLTRLSPLRDEVVANRPRLVFDQRFALPILRNRVVLDRNEREPAQFRFGLDGDERGGVFIERPIEVFAPGGPVEFSVTPQFYIQRAVKGNALADLFGVRSRVSAVLSPRTTLRGEAVLTSLDFGKVENNLRGSLRAQQLIGTHTVSLEASYRDRLFNNSLGFQDVQSSVGALFFSPRIRLGSTGVDLSYQAGYQFINAETDRADLLSPTRRNNRISLSRFQASAAISRGFELWRGRGLPPTKTEGLRYSPIPIVPYVAAGVGLTGVTSLYSNGDRQNNLNASVSVFGQFGNFSRNFFDYTGFNLTYTQAFRDGLSPFLFDRVADDRILSAEILQQIYGPLRFGFRTAYNIQTGREISTDYILEYSRRTYSVALRYNPVLQLGSINLQVSGFNWSGGSNEPFEGSGVRPVQGGVQQLP